LHPVRHGVLAVARARVTWLGTHIGLRGRFVVSFAAVWPRWAGDGLGLQCHVEEECQLVAFRAYFVLEASADLVFIPVVLPTGTHTGHEVFHVGREGAEFWYVQGAGGDVGRNSASSSLEIRVLNPFAVLLAPEPLGVCQGPCLVKALQAAHKWHIAS
jgi:hypothetical protein